MTTTTPQLDDVLRCLAALRDEVGRLSARIDAWEAKTVGRTSSAASAPSLTPTEAVSEELILVISAAVAAFLGEEPRIRHIRLLGSGSWGQQGRVTIQASHAIPVRHS